MSTAAVLFFGGENITLTLATSSVNGTYVVKSRAQVPYSGIVDGEFVDFEELCELIPRCISECHGVTRAAKIYVATPPCFCSIDISEADMTFSRPTKITPKHISEILNGGRPVYYKIDGGNALIDATGYTVKNLLHAQVSSFAISSNFIEQVGVNIRPYFKKIEFIPTVLAEAVYLIDQDVRDRTCVLISCGMFTTSVAVVAGDELIALDTFEAGLAHAINDISIVIKTSYTRAKEILASGTNMMAKEILKARYEDMAERIFAILSQTDKRMLQKPFYICGGYIDELEGARELFERAMDVKITKLVCPLTETNPPDKISLDASINYALHH